MEKRKRTTWALVEILSRLVKAGLIEKNLKKMKALVYHVDIWTKTRDTAERASTNFIGLECAWCSQERAKRRVWLERSELGERR